MLVVAIDVNLSEKRQFWLEIVTRPNVTNSVVNFHIIPTRFLLHFKR